MFRSESVLKGMRLRLTLLVDCGISWCLSATVGSLGFPVLISILVGDGEQRDVSGTRVILLTE